MESNISIDVAALDLTHRRALEEVMGRKLARHQRLLIKVVDSNGVAATHGRPVQKLDDWLNIYDGLTGETIETIDRIAKTRADLTRDHP